MSFDSCPSYDSVAPIEILSPAPPSSITQNNARSARTKLRLHVISGWTVQRTLFPREYYSLVHNHPISKHSKLIALTPYVDKDDLIHVRGRLRNSALSHQSKNPIILAPHPLVTSLIRDVHLKALHAGPQLTLARLREEFWLLRARQTIRSVLHQCIVCTREKAAVSNELMGDLPDSSPPGSSYILSYRNRLRRSNPNSVHTGTWA